MSKCLRHLLLSGLLLTSLAAAPMPWEQLKVGMAGDEIVTLLGEPLMRSAGRGFETWTYDDGAEVLVCGLVVGWTLPASDSATVRSVDVWRAHPRGDYLGTLRTALRKAGTKAPVNQAIKHPVRASQPVNPGLGYEEYSTRG